MEFISETKLCKQIGFSLSGSQLAQAYAWVNVRHTSTDTLLSIIGMHTIFGTIVRDPQNIFLHFLSCSF